MPMAFDPGDGGNRSDEARRITPRRAPSGDTTMSPRGFEPDDRAVIPIETGVRPVLVLTVISRWETAGDERTCPVCAPLHGRIFRNDDGPVPPLHRSCRCRRVNAGMEITTRET